MRTHHPSRARPPRGRPSSAPLVPLAILALLCGAAAATAAEEIRFASLGPAGPPGRWEAVVVTSGKAEGLKGKIAFLADGRPLDAKVEVQDARSLRATIEGVPADAAAIQIGLAGGRRTDAVASVRVKAAGAEEAPFDDWIVYHVYVATFRDGEKANDGQVTGWRDAAYAGGDLQGVLASLDHIRDLGANAIWLSPIFAANTSHGYDVTNYHRIGDSVGVAGDPNASLDLFRKVVAGAHERGIKVVLDVPLNHASRRYDFATGDPDGLRPMHTGPRQDAEKLWDSWGSGYLYWNFDNERTRRFLTGVALRWLGDEGADGLRLDYVRGVPHDFWAQLYGEVKKAKPGAFLLGECWIDAEGPEANAKDIATYFERAGGGPQFDALLDFPMQITMTSVFARGGAATDLERWLQASEAAYGPGAAPARFLDNHDLARFMAWTDDPNRLVAALGFMAALTGPEVIFYGTETGLASSERKDGFTDSGRVPMPWDKLDAALMARVQGILGARRAHTALSRGGRLPLFADKDALVMAKAAPGELALVGVNLSASARELDLSGVRLPAAVGAAGGAPGSGEAADAGDTAGAARVAAGPAAFKAVIGESAPTWNAGSGRLTWHLPPMSTSIAMAAAR